MPTGVRRFAVAAGAMVLYLAAAPPAAHAQSIGLRAGINVATEHSSYPDGALVLITGTKADIRPVGGGFIGTDDRIPLGVHIEVLYDEVGIRLAQSDTPVRYTYITIPVLAKARLTHRGWFRAHLIGGPSFSALVNARRGGSDPQDVENVDKLSVGATVGAIFSLGQILLDTRYTWGLTNTIENPPPGFKTTRRVLGVSVGFQFGP